MFDWLSEINPNELIKASFGGIVGFVLAQMFNVAKFVHGWWVRPVLKIDTTVAAYVDHDSIATSDQRKKKVSIAVRIRNDGRRVAENIKCHVTKMELAKGGSDIFQLVSDRIVELPAFNERTGRRDKHPVDVLIPGASLAFLLAEMDLYVATKEIEKTVLDLLPDPPAGIPFVYLGRITPPDAGYSAEAMRHAHGNKKFRMTVAVYGHDRKTFIETLILSHSDIPRDFVF